MAPLLALLLAVPSLAAPRRAEPIRALTFNVAGIPVVHSRWGARRRAIARALKASDYDIAAIQEVWLDGDAKALAAESGFPHSTRYLRRVELGTGLMILSRWPILERYQGDFTCRPSIIRFPQGESVANKGALMARVETPAGPLDVWTAHLISDYPEARYRTLRLTQLYELAEMIQKVSAGRPAVVLGDFNMQPGDPEYELFLELLGLENACGPGPAACGPTNYTGEAIDHVFLPRGGRGRAKVRAAFAGTIPDGRVSWSDHLAVEADLDPAVLRLKLAPERRVQTAALGRVQANLKAMIEQMQVRLRLRSWIPVYGFLMTLRYDKQLGQLRDLHARVETARILALGPR